MVAALASASLFALAHGSQNSWLFADRFMFALVASWLVWRTGGLEASIALHAVYNLLSFAVALLTGQLDDMILATEADGLLVALDLVSMLVAAGVLAWLAKRSGIVSRFRPPGVA